MPPRNQVDRECNILPHESEPTSIWSLSTRKTGQSGKEAKQMVATSLRDANGDPQVAGAASHDATSWQTINWSKAQRIVRRLQARIVQTTQAGRWGKVKALQRLLTHSYSGKVVAVRRVTENHGKRTPGVDGETWNTPAKKATAVQHLRQRGYHPQPLRRVYIAKRSGTNQRPLGIPVMADRTMQVL